MKNNRNNQYKVSGLLKTCEKPPLWPFFHHRRPSTEWTRSCLGSSSSSSSSRPWEDTILIYLNLFLGQTQTEESLNLSLLKSFHQKLFIVVVAAAVSRLLSLPSANQVRHRRLPFSLLQFSKLAPFPFLPSMPSLPLSGLSRSHLTLPLSAKQVIVCTYAAAAAPGGDVIVAVIRIVCSRNVVVKFPKTFL